MQRQLKTSPVKFLSLNDKELAFLLVRIGLGINLFFHGLVRLPNLSGFVKGMETQFAESLLPIFLVTPMAYAIPIAEFLIGFMLIMGIFTRWSLVAVAVQMMVLITGCCFTQSWDPINSQVILLVLSAFLITQLELNRFAVTVTETNLNPSIQQTE